MMTFLKALEEYRQGFRILSIVTNNIYELGKIDIFAANSNEKEGFWIKL